MAGYCRYKRLKKQVSYDSGATWQDVSPAEYMKGDLIEADSTICGYAVYTRWVESGYTCVGYDKHAVEYEQTSNDNINWTYTQRSRTGRLLEANSEDCGYVPPTPPSSGYANQYFTVVGKGNGQIRFSGSTSGSSTNTLQYSTNSGSTWTTASSSITASVSSGQTIMFKGTCTPYSSSKGIGRFSASTSFDVEGNIMSLLYGDNFSGQTSLEGKNYTFSYLFGSCSTLQSAENLILPATTLATYCYSRMFYGCSSLTTPPELPATSLATRCYQSMFNGCSSLTTAPELPATTLANYCYINMFYNCASLSSVTCLATDISATDCSKEWLYNVSSTGTFTKAASMANWPTGYNGIPSGWTVLNNS